MPTSELYTRHDIIVIGCGSGGLSVGLFMAAAGFKVMMVSRTEESIGGECLNDGCVPSKALIHVSRLVQAARQAGMFGLTVQGQANLAEVMAYIRRKQAHIRQHENADWLRAKGISVVIGHAAFCGKDCVSVNGKLYRAKNIVLATGSRPRKLKLPGVETVDYHDNESIFHLKTLPARLLVIGGGPAGMEMAQAFSRLGSKVTVVSQGAEILEHDDTAVTRILMKRLQDEGIKFMMQAEPRAFPTANSADIKRKTGEIDKVEFDTVFVSIGRVLNVDGMAIEKAGIMAEGGKIKVDAQLRTRNPHVFLCGDVAGSLQFSHAAEHHGRIIINNMLSPLKQRLSTDHSSWVTFTDPEIASFGLGESVLKKKGIDYIRLEEHFSEDDRAVVDDYAYGKLILFISPKRFLRRQRILGGTMAAPQAGELIQELILANTLGLSINTIFNKIYPYPTAARVNQAAILKYKQMGLTHTVKMLLRLAYRIFG